MGSRGDAETRRKKGIALAEAQRREELAPPAGGLPCASARLAATFRMGERLRREHFLSAPLRLCERFLPPRLRVSA